MMAKRAFEEFEKGNLVAPTKGSSKKVMIILTIILGKVEKEICFFTLSPRIFVFKECCLTSHLTNL